MLFLPLPFLMTPPADGWTPRGLAIIAVIYVGIFLLVLAPGYILNALALYRIAHRRKIVHSWLAWVPIGSSWLLGRISDHYQLLVHQKKTHRAPVLLALNLSSFVGYFLILMLTFRWLEYATLGPNPLAAIGPALVGLLVMIGVMIAAIVFTLVAKYDLFRSCEPKNATAYLIVSIAVQFFVQNAGIVSPILMLICSKKDEGMPPPRPEDFYEEPA